MFADIITLNEVLQKHNTNYRETGFSSITDAEYDNLEAKLKMLCDEYPEYRDIATVLNKVGSDLTPTGKRIKHLTPMLSIENSYSPEELVEWHNSIQEKLSAEVPLVMEPKWDGVSIDLLYEDGDLIQALTRGDGEYGEDVTAQIMQIESIPKVIPIGNSATIRGEIMVTHKMLVEINKRVPIPYTSTRNLAAGSLKLKTLEEIKRRKLEFVAYEFTGAQCQDSIPYSSRMVNMATHIGSQLLNFEVMFTPVTSPENIPEVLSAQINRVAEIREKYGLDCDGVVVKLDSYAQRKLLGVGSKFTNYQMCFKPQNSVAETTLNDIVWQVGRTGRVTPVGIIDPVTLAGASISRCTLNNLTWLTTMSITPGCTVEVRRSGEVIPEIVRVISAPAQVNPVLVPSQCPACDTVLELRTTQGSDVTTLYCTNKQCKAQLIGTLTFIADRKILDLDGLGPELAGHLVNGGYVLTFDELFEFQEFCMGALKTVPKATFERRFLKKGFPSGAAAYKLVMSMEGAKTAGWDKWIAALGIPQISRLIGKILAQELRLTSGSMAAFPDILLAHLEGKTVYGVGEVKTANLISWANNPDNRRLCALLYKYGVRPQALCISQAMESRTALSGIAFVITGGMVEDREILTKKLVSLGAVSKSGVSSRVNLLIVGKAPGNTKLTKAKNLGIKMVGEEWVAQIYKRNGLQYSLNSGFDCEEAD